MRKAERVREMARIIRPLLLDEEEVGVGVTRGSFMFFAIVEVVFE